MTDIVAEKQKVSTSSQRLSELLSASNPEGVFTSDLSVSEFLLVKEAGFEPLGMVMGCSIYHIGLQRSKRSENREMEVLTEALYSAREHAISRMEQEAEALGADGVVAVRLMVKEHAWGEHIVEYIAIGTAVIAKDKSINYKTPSGKPFTSSLSGQDFWTTLQAGYRPLSLVLGTCVYHIASRSMRQFFSQMGQNCELTQHTQALYHARELAMERMQHEANEVKAEGVIDVILRESSYRWESHIIEFFAMGTSVVAISDNHVISKPEFVIPLN